MTRFSPPFLPVSRQEARRSSGSDTHQMRLTVNLKMAKALGVEVSRSVLRAACSGLYGVEVSVACIKRLAWHCKTAALLSAGL